MALLEEWIAGVTKDGHRLPEKTVKKYRDLLGIAHTPIPTSRGEHDASQIPKILAARAESIGLGVGGVTAVIQDGILVWERMDGLGDLVFAVLRRLRLDKPAKRFIAWWWGVSVCQCAARQAAWNTRFPFPAWLSTGIRLFIGPWSRL